MTAQPSDNSPWVAIIYSAIEPAGRRGGGIHNAVIGQALGLKANGVEVGLFTASDACAVEARQMSIAVDLDKAWNSGIDPVFSKRIWREARHERGRLPAAVIHNNGRTWLAGALLFPGALQVQVLHREKVAPYRFFRNWISLSEHYARSLKGTLSGRFRNIAVAPNGLKSDPRLPQKRHHDRALIVGTVGRFGDIKGTDTLIDAAQIVHRADAPLRFRIAGEAPEDLISSVEQRGLSQIIDFVGWTDDVDGFLDSVDVFCLPSRKESFGIVLIEAMARGLPIVSTATNGALEIVEEGKTGWLVPIGNAQALALTLQEVASNRSELARRGALAYDVVSARYSPRATGRQLIDALHTLGASALT